MSPARRSRIAGGPAGPAASPGSTAGAPAILARATVTRVTAGAVRVLALGQSPGELGPIEVPTGMVLVAGDRVLVALMGGRSDDVVALAKL